MNRDQMGEYNCAKKIQNTIKMHALKQRLTGAALAAIGIISIPLLDMNITGAVFAVPVGLYLFFNSELID